MAPSYSVISLILIKKFLWSLSKILLSIILLPLSIIFTSLTSLYLSFSIHHSMCFIRTDVVGSVSFIVFFKCLSIFFSFGMSFLRCFLQYNSLLVLAINCLSSFLSAFNFLSLLLSFFNALLVCFFFFFRIYPHLFLNNFSHCIKLISDAKDDILSMNVLTHNTVHTLLDLFWQHKFM